MEFESPDVEKDFPGLYASESGKRSQESDFSDEAHERPSKKDLLIGKRKEKKESKKDLGYAALEGESSPEEDLDVKSPSKSKKSKAFKFPTIKEKREKSREKETSRDKERDKEKEKERDKEVDKDRDKKKEIKSKLKLKDRKKSKHGEESVDLGDEMPVFGVPLTIAVQRSRCHDGVELPVVVRDCIDHVQEYGLLVEGIYKVSGVKSKVQHLRRNYNQRDPVRLSDYDLPIVTSLLKKFLRELPEPLLTTDLVARFEEASGIRESAAREQDLIALTEQLPLCHRICLSWIIKHLDSVAAHERQNKMGVNALGVTLGSVVQMSPRLLGALLTHCRVLFPDVRLVKYIPPLSAGSLALPNSRAEICAELAKQESLLNQIHSEMNHGYITKRREEQLWEVQRLITQLKRKLRSLEKEATQPQQDEAPVSVSAASSTVTSAPVSSITNVAVTTTAAATPASSNQDTSPAGEVQVDCRTQVTQNERNVVKVDSESDTDDAANTLNLPQTAAGDEVDTTVDSGCGSVSSSSVRPADPTAEANALGGGSEDCSSQTCLQLEHRELLILQAQLQSRVKQEQETVERLRAEIAVLQRVVRGSSCHAPSRTNSDAGGVTDSSEGTLDENEDEKQKDADIRRQNAQLLQNKSTLVRQIISEREACLQLKVQLGLLQLREGKHI